MVTHSRSFLLAILLLIGSIVVSISFAEAQITLMPSQTTTFPVATISVSSTTKVIISATYGGTTKSAKLKVKK